MLAPADNDLWLAMWKNQQTDFHKNQVNQQLQRHWPQLAMPLLARVLVPLCGKTQDLLWLAAKGLQVIGVELSPIAVKAFFKENHLKPKKTRIGNFTVWQHGTIRILCGDFFLLKHATIGRIDAVYDSAALTALPEALRKSYVSKLVSLMPQLKPMLLLTHEDNDPLRNKNSAALIDQEVAALYSPYFSIAVNYGNSYQADAKQNGVNKVYHMSKKRVPSNA